MPEGPEVRKEINKLKKFKNKKLFSINFLGGRYKRHGPPKMYKKIKKELPLKIISINNKGKFVWIQLDKGWSIWITLGMTGKLINNCGKKLDCIPHNNVEFKTNSGIFYMNDVRNFGTVKFCNNIKDLDKKLNSLGPDLIVDKVSKDYLYNKIKESRSKKTIAEFLLDQKVLSGVGNYVRADALYMSKISPFRKIKSLTKKESEKLQKNIKKVLIGSYKQTRQYSKLIIYHQKVSPSGNKIIRNVLNGRGIWWVPSIQK